MQQPISYAGGEGGALAALENVHTTRHICNQPPKSVVNSESVRGTLDTIQWAGKNQEGTSDNVAAVSGQFIHLSEHSLFLDFYQFTVFICTENRLKSNCKPTIAQLNLCYFLDAD